MSVSRRLTRAVAGALAVAALAAPGAERALRTRAGERRGGPAEAIVSGEPVVVRTPDPGFDWGAAALGAGAAAGLLLLAGAGGSVVTHRPRRAGAPADPELTGPSCPHRGRLTIKEGEGHEVVHRIGAPGRGRSVWHRDGDAERVL